MLRRLIGVAGIILLATIASARVVSWGGNVAIAASARNLTTLFSYTTAKTAYRVVVKNSAAAVNNVYCGDSTVTTSTNVKIELVPGQAYDFVSIGNRTISSDEIYCIGTVGATNYIVVNAYE